MRHCSWPSGILILSFLILGSNLWKERREQNNKVNWSTNMITEKRRKQAFVCCVLYYRKKKDDVIGSEGTRKRFKALWLIALLFSTLIPLNSCLFFLPYWVLLCLSHYKITKLNCRNGHNQKLWAGDLFNTNNTYAKRRNSKDNLMILLFISLCTVTQKWALSLFYLSLINLEANVSTASIL